MLHHNFFSYKILHPKLLSSTEDRCQVSPQAQVVSPSLVSHLQLLVQQKVSWLVSLALPVITIVETQIKSMSIIK